MKPPSHGTCHRLRPAELAQGNPPPPGPARRLLADRLDRITKPEQPARASFVPRLWDGLLDHRPAHALLSRLTASPREIRLQQPYQPWNTGQALKHKGRSLALAG